MIKKYLSKGFLKARLFTKNEFQKIENFTLLYVSKLINKYHNNSSLKSKNLIKNYHKLKINSFKHSRIFRAENRHLKMSIDLKRILLKKKNIKLFRKLIKAEYNKNSYNLWDEKYGNLAFRIVRPFSEDGYPFTKKEWGPAGKVISIWIPLIGMNKNNTIKFVTDSIRKDYKKFLPKKTKFIKNEFRLGEKISNKKIKSLQYTKGDVFIFSSKLLHSEDNNTSKLTRLNLEFRIK